MSARMFSFVLVGTFSLSAAAAAPVMPLERQYGELDIREFTDAPLQISMKVQLDAPPSEVFRLVTTDIPAWFESIPSVDWNHDASENDADYGAGSVRSCAVGDDYLVEDILWWDDASLVAYSVDVAESTAAPPFRDHVGVMQVEDDGNGGSVLTWHQYYSRRFHPMAPMVNMYMRSVMGDGLDALIEQAGGGEVLMRR